MVVPVSGSLFVMNAEQRESLRQSCVANFRRIGAPADEAGLIVDISLHAVDSAIRAVEECCDRIPGNNSISAMGLAFGVLGGLCESAEEAIRRTMVGQPGAKSADFQVDVGDPA